MKSILVLIALLFNTVVFACDHCNIFMNLSPNDYKNSFGVYMRTRTMFGEYNIVGRIIEKHASHNNFKYWNKAVTEQYNTLELRGSFYIKEKWNTQIIVPISNNYRLIDDDTDMNVSGIGDPIIFQRYQLYNTKCISDTMNFSQRITLGAGVKLPLGSIYKTYHGTMADIDMQPGTGSTDALLSFTYLARYKSTGINLNTNYKLNTFNKEQYKYGNALNINADVFQFIPIKKVQLMAYTGIYAEYSAYDETTELHYDTGGATYFVNSGLKLYTNTIALTTQLQLATSNQLNGTSQLNSKHRFFAGVNYNF